MLSLKLINTKIQSILLLRQICFCTRGWKGVLTKKRENVMRNKTRKVRKSKKNKKLIRIVEKENNK
jgi:hypothetical protein